MYALCLVLINAYHWQAAPSAVLRPYIPMFAGDLVVLIKEGVSAITDSILGSMDMPVEEAEEATQTAAVA